MTIISPMQTYASKGVNEQTSSQNDLEHSSCFSVAQYGVGTIEVLIESLDDNNTVLATKRFAIWMITDENGLFVGTNGGEALYTYYKNYCNESNVDMLENCSALDQLRPADPISEGYIEYPETVTYSFDPSMENSYQQ